jgi:hypothetical protein
MRQSFPALGSATRLILARVQLIRQRGSSLERSKVPGYPGRAAHPSHSFTSETWESRGDEAACQRPRDSPLACPMM